MLVAWTKWETAGKVLPVVVVGRGIEEGPELGPHRQGGDRLFQAGRALSGILSGTSNGKKLCFLPRVLEARRGVDSIWAGGKG